MVHVVRAVARKGVFCRAHLNSLRMRMRLTARRRVSGDKRPRACPAGLTWLYSWRHNVCFRKTWQKKSWENHLENSPKVVAEWRDREPCCVLKRETVLVEEDNWLYRVLETVCEESDSRNWARSFAFSPSRTRTRNCVIGTVWAGFDRLVVYSASI